MKGNQIMKNRCITFTAILCTLVCVGLLPLAPNAFGVFPPPDGGYPGQNTAEGDSALLHLAGGTYNTALGWASLGFNVTGDYNTGVGAATLLKNTADENTAVGAGALLNNTTGLRNTATGTFALFGNTAGSDNTANGDKALFNNMLGNGNTAIGTFALRTNTTGGGNTAVGFGALLSNNSTENTAVGFDALLNNTLGYSNTAMGWHALLNSTQGSGNTAIGYGALEDATSISGNTALGYRAGSNVTTANNVICIDTLGANVSNSCYIGNIWTEPGGTQAVYVNSQGKLGELVSSRRFKDEIMPMEQTSEVIYGLRPVSFRYKPAIEPTRPQSFGLIAEEVEKINPDLVSRAKDGKPLSVRYDQVNAMLLNEFLKEHKKVQALEATVVRQQKGIEVLTAQLKEQATQIQKVSAQVEMSRSAPQIVLNNQ
jgi:trimeric autotransporter adhesin